MRVRWSRALAMLLVLCFAGEAGAAQLEFKASQVANFFWAVDQMSQWDPEFTSKSYRNFWDTKIQFTDDDLQTLDRYASLRRKYSRSDRKSRVATAASAWPGATVEAHERFALAFLEMSSIDTACLALKMSAEDTNLLVGTMRHFARRMKDHWGRETAHLKGFGKKAQVLITLADAGGFAQQLKAFFGVTVPIPRTIPVDVVWAPPGYVPPARLDFHIVLPVSVEQAQSDEAVLQQISRAMQEVAAYLLSKAPADTLERAAQMVLTEGGLLNQSQPDLFRRAMLLSLGELVFLRDRFPELPEQEMLAPFDPALEFPFAEDLLARELAGPLKANANTKNGFFPTFLKQGIEVQKRLFPPRPRFFTSNAITMGGPASLKLFSGLFTDLGRVSLGLKATRELSAAHKNNSGAPKFIIATASEEGRMWKALRTIRADRALSKLFRSLKKKTFIYANTQARGGVVFVIYGQSQSSIRKALMRLYTMQGMPLAPIVVE